MYMTSHCQSLCSRIFLIHSIFKHQRKNEKEKKNTFNKCKSRNTNLKFYNTNDKICTQVFKMYTKIFQRVTRM